MNSVPTLLREVGTAQCVVSLPREFYFVVLSDPRKGMRLRFAFGSPGSFAILLTINLPVRQ
ncbi:MAG: hypothetical protein KDA69_08595 [Planctomycetaceae bacterium]|nr:hypothetical protein [Planctomycetaceae bacterium]MCA9044365.1 hypothetical protein [Planctomycetaceae bacterium]